MRHLTPDELDLIECLLNREVPGAKQLSAQLSGALVYPINDDQTILRFSLSPNAVPAVVPYVQSAAVEAKAIDTDGIPIEVLLHVKDGLIWELEYVKVDGSPLRKRPAGRELKDFFVFQ